MNPYSLSAMTGIPTHGPKKKARRPKKPGGNHLAQLTQAHGAGDYAKAKTHALNYAKSVHTHLSEEADEAPMTNTPAATPPAGVSSLAALMRSRKK